MNATAARERHASEARGFTDFEILRTREGDEMVVHTRLVEAPRGTILLAHGVGEHARRYGPLAARLAAAGFSVIAPDHLGHGLTAERGRGLGKVGPGTNLRARRALSDVARLARSRAEQSPLILLGHSWGSLLGQQLLNHSGHLFSAAVFTGTTLPVPGLINPGKLNAAYAACDDTGLAWLSRDEEQRALFAADPYCFDTAKQPVWSSLQAAQLLSFPRHRLDPNSPGDLPILILAGSNDPLGFGARGPKMLARALRRWSGCSDVTLRIYPEARHEVFFERNRDEITEGLIAWLRDHFPAR